MKTVIAICGIDGSGKITQLKLLTKCLDGRGFKAKLVWFHWTAFMSHPFLALCRLLRYTMACVKLTSGSMEFRRLCRQNKKGLAMQQHLFLTITFLFKSTQNVIFKLWAAFPQNGSRQYFGVSRLLVSGLCTL